MGAGKEWIEAETIRRYNLGMKTKHRLAWICWGISGLLGLWSLWPVAVEQHEIAVRLAGASEAGLPEQMVLEAPGVIRLGQNAEVKLQLPARDGSGLPATAVVEARLEITGVDIEPGSRLMQTVIPGREITLRWLVSPYQAGQVEGMLWLNWTITLNGQEQRLPVLARPVEMQVVGFLGWPVWVAQVTALLLAVGGGVLWRSGARRISRTRR